MKHEYTVFYQLYSGLVTYTEVMATGVKHALDLVAESIYNINVLHAVRSDKL